MGELEDELRSPDDGSLAAVTGRAALEAWAAKSVFAKGEEWAGTVGRDAAAPGGSAGVEEDLENSIAQARRCHRQLVSLRWRGTARSGGGCVGCGWEL